MNWGGLRSGDILISMRSQRVYVVLEIRPTFDNWVDIELFNMYDGKRLETCKEPVCPVKPEHYEIIVMSSKADK